MKKKSIGNVPRAVVLLSGGLDSAVSLYLAKNRDFDCRCLIFDYNQRHKREIDSAISIASVVKSPYQILRIKLPWKGSSLLDRKTNIIQRVGKKHIYFRGIPNTYVPARNIIFLSFAISFAETINATAIFIGAHTHDYSDYPDCRRAFFQEVNKMIKVGTKSGVEGRGIKIMTPLISLSKSEIIKLGVKLGVPFELTWSCYRGGKKPCGECDSCYFRAKGFAEAGVLDPLGNKQD